MFKIEDQSTDILLYKIYTITTFIPEITGNCGMALDTHINVNTKVDDCRRNEQPTAILSRAQVSPTLVKYYISAKRQPYPIATVMKECMAV